MVEAGPWKLINHEGADSNDVLSICMRGAVDTGLPWEGCIDAEVPINPEEREDAPLLLMPLCGSVKAIGDPGKNLPHYRLNPSAYPEDDWAADEPVDFRAVEFMKSREVWMLLVLTTVPDDAGVVGSTRGIELLLLDCFAAECVLQQRLDCVREIACKSRGQGARKDL